MVSDVLEIKIKANPKQVDTSSVLNQVQNYIYINKPWWYETVDGGFGEDEEACWLTDNKIKIWFDVSALKFKSLKKLQKSLREIKEIGPFNINLGDNHELECQITWTHADLPNLYGNIETIY